ncbi:hypothetical protein BGZ54_003406, partial [Gamsiella multidivaricata]
IVTMHAGYPGSRADYKVYNRMKVYRNMELHFSPSENLLVDSAHGLAKYFTPAY